MHECWGTPYLGTVDCADATANRTMAAVDMLLDLNEALERFNSHNPYHLQVRVGLQVAEAAPLGLDLP